MTSPFPGDDCSATSHDQDESKVACDGDPAGAASVFIIANEKSNPNDGKIWFSGPVDLGTTYLIDARAEGDNRLKSETHVHISDEEGDQLLQHVKFHTSCSQPLAVGYQFGANEIVGYTPEP